MWGIKSKIKEGKMKKTRNLKFLVPALLAALVLAFAGCDNGTSLEEDTNTDTPQETPVETPAETPKEETKVEEPAAEEEEVDEEETDSSSKLPASVGEDPFKGKLFKDEDGEVGYEFTSDGYIIYHLYKENEDIECSKNQYSYNATSKILYLKYVSTIYDAIDDFVLRTKSELTEYLTTHAEELGYDSEDLENMLQNIKEGFSKIFIMKAEASGNNLLLTERYYVEIPSFYDTENWSFSFKDVTNPIYKQILLHNQYQEYINKDIDQNNFGYTDSYFNGRYYLTDVNETTHVMTFSHYNNKELISYNVNYTITLDDGVFTLTICGADDNTKEHLEGYNADTNPNPTFTLKTETQTDTYTLVTE